MTTVSITYRKNPRYAEQDSASEARLFAKLDLNNLGIETPVEKLAIYYRKLERPVGAIRVVYSTNIAGLPIETGNLQRLEEAINSTISAMVRFERLPQYVFQVEDNAYPIYHLQNELLTRYPGGPVFSADNIASLRVWLGDHFKTIGRIEHRREMGLLYLSPYDLQLYAPYCVVRIPGEANPDIPIFPAFSDKGLELIAPINSISLREPFDQGMGIFAIHKVVEAYLLEREQLSERNQTTIRKLNSSQWEAIQKQLELQPRKLTFFRDMGSGLKRQILPVFKVDGNYVTGRTNRLGGTAVFQTTTLDKLRRKVGEELSSYDAINHPDDVKIIHPNNHSGDDQRSTSPLDQVLAKAAFS